MASHFAIAIGLALILAVCFGLVLRDIMVEGRKLHDDEAEMMRLALQNEINREIAELGERSARAARPPAPRREKPVRPVTPEGFTCTQDGTFIKKASR